jgi:prephenate dehydrogenase
MRITIVGTGRVGTSLGLALRAGERPPAVELWGHDKVRAHAERARALGAVDRAHSNLHAAVESADLVVLAMPLDGLEETLRLIGPTLKRDAVVTDVARLKVPVLKWAEEHLPAHVHFVGGDPLLGPAPPGAAAHGPDAASATLLRGVPYCLVPSDHAVEPAIKLVGDLARAVGARPFFIDPHEHDGVSTAVNTLPAVAAAALLQSVTRAGSWRETRRMAGQTFAQMTETGHPADWRDTLLLSQASVLPWLDAFVAELENLRAAIAAGEGEALLKRLEAAQAQRSVWLADWERGNWTDLQPTGPAAEGLPEAGNLLQRMFFGNLGRRGERGDRS